MAASTAHSTMTAKSLELDEGGVCHSELAEIHIHTPLGDSTITYDPNTLELDDDIGIVSMALQNMRNMGQLSDATIAMHMPGGTTYQLRLSEVELVK